MNNGYYQNPVFPGMPLNDNNGIDIQSEQSLTNLEKSISFTPVSKEQSYINNLLRLNIGKKAKLYVTIPGSQENQDKTFDGIIEQVGNDYIIVSNPSNGEWYLILMIYLDFITFEEKINFIKDFS